MCSTKRRPGELGGSVGPQPNAGERSVFSGLAIFLVDKSNFSKLEEIEP